VRTGGVGATGESGGGTQTFLLAAVDDRVAVAAPVNMISLRMQGGCLCENPPGLRLDTNNVEIAATIAPRPMLMVSATGDWTSDTLEREFPAMRSAYALFDAAEHVHAVRIDAPHNYNQASREAMYAWMARWLQHAPGGEARPERTYVVDPAADLLVFYGRALPAGAVMPAQLTDRWIASAKAQIAARQPSADDSVLAIALRHALGFGDISRMPPPGNRPSARRVAIVASARPDVVAALRAAGLDVRPVAFTPFDQPAAAAVKHFETYNRTAASQRVADIVAALRDAPSAVLVADGDAGLASLLALAIAPVRRAVIDVGGFNLEDDGQFLERVYIPGLRKAGDFQTAVSLARGELIVHNAGDRFTLRGLRVERAALTSREIVALARRP
jgi:hypothetical protein